MIKDFATRDDRVNFSKILTKKRIKRMIMCDALLTIFIMLVFTLYISYQFKKFVGV